jgi:hypothetical protein
MTENCGGYSMRLTTVTGDNGIYRSIRMKPDIARKLAAYARSEKCSVNAAVSRAILFAWEMKKSNPRATEHASS